MSRPLSGVVVVEAASFLSGPFAGMMLADLGADVVKIEPPGGDQYRRFQGGELSAHFVSCNRGKRSQVADLKTPQGLGVLMELIDGADVFLSNWRPEVAERIGAGDAALAARNARLIRLWITGWGTSGPAVALPAFDAVAQARSGLIDAAARDAVLQPIAGYPIDKSTALFGVQSILAALYERERSGSGTRLDLAMFDVCAYYNFPDLMTARVFVDDAPDDAHSASATSIETLPASDGALVISPVTGGQIKRACTAVGHPEWVPTVFSDPGGIMHAILRLFSPVTSQEPRSVWLDRFAAHDVPAAACLTIDEHLGDPQTQNNDNYRIERWPGVGDVRTVRHPVVAAGWGRMSSGPAPVRPGNDDRFEENEGPGGP
jgi:CoA:oxalate CoA-transferase